MPRRKGAPAFLPGRGQLASARWTPGDASNPLLLHAVNDTTLQRYTATRDAFDDWLRAHLPDCDWRRLDRLAPRALRAEALDWALLQYVTRLALRGDPPARGGFVLSALLHFHPDLKGGLPVVARAQASWTRRQPANEGGPITEGTVGLVAAALLAGDAESQAAGTAALIAYDGVTRINETLLLRIEDVSINGSTAALAFSVRARGETTKTGVNQGVDLRKPWAIEALRRHCDRHGLGADPKAKVFGDLTDDRFGQLWDDAFQRLDLDHMPPHSLRHAGAAEMFRQGYTIPDIKICGRWQSDSAVKRYIKVHLLVQWEARLPPRAKVLHAAFLSDPFRVLFGG